MKNNESYDLIGDLHGEADVLRDLLARLGYTQPRAGASHRHPHGRRVIFLGDYVDRGPAIRETLHLVRAMVESGAALALCGNHELDSILYGTPDGAGGWLRTHSVANTAMHARTQAEFADRPDEWREWLRWFQTLPLSLDLPGLRAVHACWDPSQIAILGERRLDDATLLRAAAGYDNVDGIAVRRLLCGPSVPLPEGIHITGRTGGPLTWMRVRWWHDGPNRTYREACINRYMPGPGIPIPTEHHAKLTIPQGDDRRPIFIGHYWMPPEHPAPLTPTLACLDYSVADGGPLVAYRWDGEQHLNAEKFVYDPARVTKRATPQSVAQLARV